MSTDPKFVELTPDVLKKKKNVRVTAYQFGTMGSCPTEIFWAVADFILECCININILDN